MEQEWNVQIRYKGAYTPWINTPIASQIWATKDKLKSEADKRMSEDATITGIRYSLVKYGGIDYHYYRS